MRAANLQPSIEIEERSGRPNSYHHAPDYNPFRRVSPSRGRSGSIDLEDPGAQRSTRHFLVPNTDGGQDRLSGSAFQHVESELAVGEAQKEEQDYGKDHERHPEIFQLDGQPQSSTTNEERYTPTRRPLYLMKDEGASIPNDEENPGGFLHSSTKNSQTFPGQSGLTRLARWACSFGLDLIHDIKAPLAEIGASSITNGPLVKMARKERISILRYGHESGSKDCNPLKC